MSFDIASFHAIPIFSKGSFFTSAELLLRQILLHCFAYSQVQLFLDYSGNKYEFAYSKSFFELHDWFFCVLSVVPYPQRFCVIVVVEFIVLPYEF